MNKSKYGVHRTHCCKTHGCKYGDKDCPVVSGEIKQVYECQDGDINDPCFGISTADKYEHFTSPKNKADYDKVCDLIERKEWRQLDEMVNTWTDVKKISYVVTLLADELIGEETDEAL